MNASQAFREQRMGSNMMTPKFEGYVEGNDRFVELSSGRGIDDEPIFGVTVLVLVDGEVKRDWEAGERLSKMFFSLREARSYAASLVK